MFEVTEVTLTPERVERLLGFAIDQPLHGARAHLHVLHVSGWVVGRTVPATAVEVLYNGRLLRTVPVRGARDDVSQAMGVPAETECVFHAMVSLVGLKREEPTFRVVLDDGTRVDAGRLGFRRTALSAGYEPALNPLLVTSLGRSGSTWLMQLLVSHPQIVGARRFPFENAPAKYWLHMLRVLSEPADLIESAQPDSFHNDLHWVGNNPYHDDRAYEQPPLAAWWGRRYPEHLAAFCQRQIDDWYLTLAQAQAQVSPAPLYFAEKHLWPNFLPVLAWELYPRAKEVFLVRDFRDMAQSILAFDERRGFAGFGRPEGATDEEYLRDLMSRMARDLQRSWESRGERGHLVRYEDLVRDPEGTMRGLLEYLEVDSAHETLAAVLHHGSEEVLSLPGSAFERTEVEAHRTAPDLGASVGRWRTETDAGFRALSEDVFAEALVTFGY